MFDQNPKGLQAPNPSQPLNGGPDLEARALAVFKDTVRRGSARILEASFGRPTWHAKLEGGMGAMLRFMDENRAAAYFAVVQAPGTSTAVARARAATVARAVAVIDKAARNEAPDRNPSPLIAEAAVWSVLGVIHESLATGSKVPLADLQSPLTTLLVHPYLDEAVASRRQ